MELKGSGGNDKGLYYLPQGRQYYEYLVKSSTHTSYGTVEELRDAIALRMTQDLTAMEEILTKDPDLAQEASSYAFSLTEPGAILEDLKQQCAADFPQIPQYSYTVKEVPQALEASLSPAFYLTVPLTGLRIIPSTSTRAAPAAAGTFTPPWPMRDGRDICTRPSISIRRGPAI